MGMDREKLYELIYALAARDGRDKALFGESFSRSVVAFASGLCGEAFPELWFELPLMGDPWFDLHMLVARGDVYPGVTFAGLDGAYADALDWFARSIATRQLALSFDCGRGDVGRPAVQLLLDRENLAAVEGFLTSAGRPDAICGYRAFVDRMPREWYACYSGVFPSRAGANWLRVECIVSEGLQHAYADDADLLRAHLSQVGLVGPDGELADEGFVERIQELARTPFPLEFQFDVDASGWALSTLGASVRFQPTHWQDAASLAAMCKLMGQVEAWGLADDRWRLLANTIVAKRATQGAKSTKLWCFPAFVKLRWRDGSPIDAKTYLMAGMN